MTFKYTNSTLAANAFRKVVCILAYTIWTPIGVIIWIPTLVLEVALFCGALMASMLSNNDQLFAIRKQKMDKAVVMYAAGFGNIKSVDTGIPNNEKVSPMGDYFNTFLVRVVWSIIFWVCIILILSL